MLIYTTHDTPRFRYAAEILLGPLGVAYSITTEDEKFQSYRGPKLAYCLRSFVGACSVPVIGSALWRGLPQKQSIAKGNWQGIPTLFAAEADIPFDVFAATFYLVSRYEEYLEIKRDSMGRFTSQESETGHPELLHRPLIDEWRLALAEWINTRWPNSIKIQSGYRFYSTVDVDSAYAYIGKGITRSCAGIAKDILKRDWANLNHRIQTILGWKSDKYDTYDYMEGVLQRYRCQHMYFFQLSDLAEFDRNVRFTSKTLRKRIKDLSREYTIGIHPGVRSVFKWDLLDEEKVRLENIIGQHVQHSRQHYLMLQFPKTYQELMRVGIAEDFTMGYSNDIGFRAGTCFSFYWFDLENDKQTQLLIHPVAIMDTTLRKYMKLTPDAAMQTSREIIDRVRKVGGQCMVIWHNETLSESDGWQGWRKVWEDQLAYGN